MSEWGATEPGETPITSYEFRDEYLRDSVRHNRHFCPFCGVSLIAVLIYEDGKCGKSPHFKTYPQKPHIPPCDGAPKNVRPASPKAPTLRFVDKSELFFPEELVEPRKPVAIQGTAGKSEKSFSPEEIERKRNEAGNSLGPARYRTSLLQAVAEAFQKIMKEFVARKRREGEEFAKNWLRNSLKKLPLVLYGVKRDYQTAIQTTKFLPSGKNPERIFHGRGALIREQNAFQIKNEDQCVVTGAPCSVSVIIGSDLVSETSMKKSWKNMMDQLTELAQRDHRITWFAFGKMEKVGNQCVILVKSWDHLYLNE